MPKSTSTRPLSAVAAASPRVEAVVSHHLDGFRSGVARFNELLAGHLGVPLVGLFEDKALATPCSLLSFKVSELSAAERLVLERAVEESDWHGELFLHELSLQSLEERLLQRAHHVHCGNREILAGVRELGTEAELVWTPGLILDDRLFRPAEITVFSFGMAHKLRIDMFRRLRELLDRSGKSYAVYVSAANHETASIRDAELVFREMHEVFPDELYFLGNLSDVAVANQLREATFVAAFFGSGVRANNTSVISALERGCIVITNLDRFSPGELVHLDNVIDLEQCDALPSDPLLLGRIRVRAMETAKGYAWDRLIDHFR